MIKITYTSSKIRRRLIAIVVCVCVLQSSFSQYASNTCVFKIFDSDARILTSVDTTKFHIYNEHPFQNIVVHKSALPFSSYPDSTWLLHTEEEKAHYQFPSFENVIYHPNLVIVRKSMHDTMRLHYNFPVYPFEEGTSIPIINEILFRPGQFEIYEVVNITDWGIYFPSSKIKTVDKIKIISNNFNLEHILGFWIFDSIPNNLTGTQLPFRNIHFTSQSWSKYGLLSRTDSSMFNRLFEKYHFTTPSVILNYTDTARTPLLFDLDINTGKCEVLDVIDNKVVKVMDFKIRAIEEHSDFYLMEIVYNNINFVYIRRKISGTVRDNLLSEKPPTSEWKEIFPKIITDFALGYVKGFWKLDSAILNPSKTISAPKSIDFSGKWSTKKYSYLLQADSALFNKLRRQCNYGSVFVVILEHSSTSIFDPYPFDLDRKTGNCDALDVVNNKAIKILSFKINKITELRDKFIMEITYNNGIYLYEKIKNNSATEKSLKGDVQAKMKVFKTGEYKGQSENCPNIVFSKSDKFYFSKTDNFKKQKGKWKLSGDTLNITYEYEIYKENKGRPFSNYEYPAYQLIKESEKFLIVDDKLTLIPIGLKQRERVYGRYRYFGCNVFIMQK